MPSAWAVRRGRTAAWDVGREVIKGHSRALGADPGILSPRCRCHGQMALFEALELVLELVLVLASGMPRA